MIVARRFLIGGRVQGVGFRMFAEARAAVEGVHGYVRNLPDGRVEALVEGDEESVDRVELALRRGPPARAWSRSTSNPSSRRGAPPASRRGSRVADHREHDGDRWKQLKSKIRHVPDFPKAGILFYDVTTLLRDPEGSGSRSTAWRALPRPRHRSRRRHREPRIHSRRRGRRSHRRRIRPVRKLGKLPSASRPSQLRSRVRQRQPGDAPRRDRAGPARADRRRPARDGRHRARDGRSGQAARGRSSKASRS